MRRVEFPGVSFRNSKTCGPPTHRAGNDCAIEAFVFHGECFCSRSIPGCVSAADNRFAVERRKGAAGGFYYPVPIGFAGMHSIFLQLSQRPLSLRYRWFCSEQGGVCTAEPTVCNNGCNQSFRGGGIIVFFVAVCMINADKLANLAEFQSRGE